LFSKRFLKNKTVARFVFIFRSKLNIALNVPVKDYWLLMGAKVCKIRWLWGKVGGTEWKRCRRITVLYAVKMMHRGRKDAVGGFFWENVLNSI